MNMLSELKIPQLQSIMIGLYNFFNTVFKELVPRSQVTETLIAET